MDQRRQIHQVIGLMQKNLECVICLDIMKKPVSTKCGHQFCGFCLREFLKTKKSVPCPLCKEPVTKRSLVDRPHLSEIVDNVRSLVNAVELDIGHFSPERGLQLNFLPSTPEELPTSRQTRGSKRKEKEGHVTTHQDTRTKRRKSDTTGLCQEYLTKQPTRRSDTTGQGQQMSNTTGQGQQRSYTTGHGQQMSNTTGQGQQRSNTTGQGQQSSNTTGQGQPRSNTTDQGQQTSNTDQNDLSRNPSTKKTRKMRSSNGQYLLEEIRTADMKSVSPETHSISTGDAQAVEGSGKKTTNQSNPEQNPCRITRSGQKSADRRESSSGRTRNSNQDSPNNDNLLQYLANESCGAIETGQQDRPETDKISHDPLLQNVDICYGSSDDNSDVDMIYSNVCDEENIYENKEPFGKDLITLGKEAKMLKDKILQGSSLTCDGIENKDGISGSEDEEVNNAIRADVIQQEKDGNSDRNDQYTTTSIDVRNKENSEYRPKKKLLFRKKQNTDVEEEEVIRLSGTSSGGSCHNFFDKRNITRTYGKKQDSKQEKDRIVKKWLKSTSTEVDEFADTNSMSDVQTETGEISKTSSEKKKVSCVINENETRRCVDNLLKPNDHNEGLVTTTSNDRDNELVVNNRKKIFKTKPDHPVGVATTVQHVKGKGKFVVRKVSPVRVEQAMEKSKSVMKTKSGENFGDSQGSDPYEFKPSQKTPKTSKGKKKVLGKKDTKKCRKNPITIQVGDCTVIRKEKVTDPTLQTSSSVDKGSRSSLRSRSKENIEDSINHCSSSSSRRRKKQGKEKSHGALTQGTEDVEKIIEDLNQAEAFDLITCTQEATDQIVDKGNDSHHTAVEISDEEGRGEESSGEERSDVEGCIEPGIKTLDKIRDTQGETDIEIVNYDHPKSSTNSDRVSTAIQKQMDVESNKCDDSELATGSVNIIADTCTEEKNDTESRKCDHPESTADNIDMISDTETSTLQHPESETANFVDVPSTQLKDLPASHGGIQSSSVSHRAVMNKVLHDQPNSGGHEECRRKKQNVESCPGQVDGRVGLSTEEDTECGSLVSDASCVPNTDDSIMSRRTKKLRNSVKGRKSVTFTEKVQHILDQDNSQGNTGKETRTSGSETRGQRLSQSETRGRRLSESETRGQRLSESETRGRRLSESETRGQRLSESETIARGRRLSESETRGQRLSESETRDHSQDKLDRVTRGQRSSGSETRGQRSSESETRGQRSPGNETRGHSQGQCDEVTRGQKLTGSKTRGQRSKNLMQALPQKGFSSPGTRSQHEVTTDEIQCIEDKLEQNAGQSDQTKRLLSEGNINDTTTSCIADTVSDKLESSSQGSSRKSCRNVRLLSPTAQKNTEEELVVVHSQTFDPEQELYTECEMSGDRIPDTDAETVHPCGENTQESLSTQPPSDDCKFGVSSGLDRISESSPYIKNLRGRKSRKVPDTPRNLLDKSPLVVMETQMSGNTSGGCESIETQESVSLLVGNDFGQIEKPVEVSPGRKCGTAEKQFDNCFTEIDPKRLSAECFVEHNHDGKAEKDLVQPVSQRNKLKRQSQRTSNQVSSLSKTLSRRLGNSATKKMPSCLDNNPSSGVVCAESEANCGEDSTTSSGSTVIPATARASRESTQIIQICKVGEEPQRKGNMKNTAKNEPQSTLTSEKLNDMSLSEESTEKNSKARKLRSSSRSLGKRYNEEGIYKGALSEESQAVCSQNQQESQGHQNGKGQQNIQGQQNGRRQQNSPGQQSGQVPEGIQEHQEESGKPSDINQKSVQEEVEKSATELIDEKLQTNESVDVDDLTPTLKPVEKSHNRTRVTRQTCSPEDIFMIDSETMASGQLSSVVQNQEGVINLTSLELLDPSQPPSLDKDTELRDYSDSEHSSMETSQSKEILDKEMNEIKCLSDQKLCIGEQDNMTMEKYKKDEKKVKIEKKQDNVKITDKVEANKSKLKNGDSKMSKSYNDSDPDSDLSQGHQTRETGVRCKRGLATRKWQLESQINSCEARATYSKEKDSSKSPGQLKRDEQNSGKRDEESVMSDAIIDKEIPIKTQSLLNNDKSDSDNLDVINLKEKFKKTFKKRSSGSQNLNRVIGSSPRPIHSPDENHLVQQRENDSLDSDEDEMGTPEFVDTVEEKSESVNLIPDSFPCSNKTKKNVNPSKKTCKSLSADLVPRSYVRKIGQDSPKMSTSQKSAEDRLHLSDSLDKSEDGTSSFEGQRRRVVGRRKRRPVIEESDDDLYDSSPLPDVVLNSCQQASTDMDPDAMNVSLESAHSGGEDGAGETDRDPDAMNVSLESANSGGEDGAGETDRDKGRTTVIAESDEERSNDYSSSEESDSGRRLNLTSSSAFSSQSEAMTTQNRKALEKDLERMKRDIAELEKQLANDSNQNGRSTPQSSSKRKAKEPKVDFNKERVVSEDFNKKQVSDDSDNECVVSEDSDKERVISEDSDKEQVISEDSDSDLVLEVDRDGQNTVSDGDLRDGMIDLVTSSPVIKTSQGSRFREVEDGMSDWHEGDDLFLSPLPPSPPPTPSQPGKRPPSKLSQEQVPQLSSPCGNSGMLKEELASPKTADVDHKGEGQQRGFVTTGLTYLQTREIQKLAQQNNDKFYVKFNPSVTHVIVKTVPQGGRVCERTLKFFQGLAHQCWVLDYQWITDSKTAGHLLPENKYEVVGDTITGNRHYGPRQSRLSSQPLFDGYHFFCLGTSDSLTTENLQELIERCGGTVVDHPSAFPPDTKLNLAVTCIDLEDEDDLPSPEDTRSFNKLHKRFGLLTVSREWVLDSLTVYTVQPLKDYVLTTVRHIQIPDLVVASNKS